MVASDGRVRSLHRTRVSLGLVGVVLALGAVAEAKDRDRGSRHHSRFDHREPFNTPSYQRPAHRPVHRPTPCATPRHDPFGWYGGSPHTSSVHISANFGPTILYNRWGQHCSGVSYAGYRYRSAYGRYGYRYYGSEPWYSGPSTHYRLVDVDPALAATRVPAAAASGEHAGSGYHQWQAEVRAQRALAGETAIRSADVGADRAVSAVQPAAVPHVPGPASVSKSPTAAQKGQGTERVKADPPRSEPLSANEVNQAWEALEQGRYLEAHALFARGADAPALPGSADQRAAFSAGYAIAAAMLNKDEAAAWALRRAADLNPEFAGQLPWSDALRERVREALRRAAEMNDAQPTPDRATLARLLATVAPASSR